MANIDNPTFIQLLKGHLVREIREAFREAMGTPMSGNLVETHNARAKHVLDGLKEMVDIAVDKAASESRAPSRSASGGPSSAAGSKGGILDLMSGWFSGPPAAARSSSGQSAAPSEGNSLPTTPVARSRSASRLSFGESTTAPGPNAATAGSNGGTALSRSSSGPAAAPSRASSGASAGSWTGGRGKTRRTGRSKPSKRYSK